MANNRIYLKCNACGKTLFLGKSFMSGYHYVNYERITNRFAKSLETLLNEFYDEHAYCGDCHNDGDFSIEYETPLEEVRT